MNELIKNKAARSLTACYKEACILLQALLIDLSDKDFIKVRDPLTQDKNCRSIQSILNHVINAGKYYNQAIRSNENIVQPVSSVKCQKPLEAYKALTTLISETENIFIEKPNLKLEENDQAKKIKVSWGQLYDIEQLLEHAIVHVLRHTKQIEAFLKLD